MMAMAKKLKVKVNIPGAKIPDRPSDGAAWLDVFSAVDACVWVGDTLMIDTGVSVAMPANTTGLICSHSGLAAKKGLAISGGSVIISAEFRGSVKVPITNDGTRNQWIRKGDKIGRLLLLPASAAEVDLVEEFADRVEEEAAPEDDTIARAEEDLRNFTALRVAAMYGDAKAGGTVERIEQALEVIADDSYHDIIRLYYINGCTREEIAEIFETSVTTVSRNKARLIGKIARIICPREI